MSWASTRETTRIEDIAYCLVGLFDVNMPLLYGEGQKAFQRLQHEIASSREDDSLFAWYTSGLCSDSFAPSPAAFGRSGDTFVPDDDVEGDHLKGTPFTITSRGLSVTASFLAIPFESIHGHRSFDPALGSREFILIVLNCSVRSVPFGILLTSLSRGVFARFLPGDKRIFQKYSGISQSHRPYLTSEERTIYIRGPSLNTRGLYDPSCVVEITQAPTAYKLLPPGTLSGQQDFPGQQDFVIWELAIYWAGFAHLEYRAPHRLPTFVVLRHYCNPAGRERVHFHTLKQATTLSAAMRTCYLQDDFLCHDELLEEHRETGDTPSKQLRRTQEGDIYTLEVSTEDWLWSDRTTFYNFSVSDQ